MEEDEGPYLPEGFMLMSTLQFDMIKALQVFYTEKYGELDAGEYADWYKGYQKRHVH